MVQLGYSISHDGDCSGLHAGEKSVEIVSRGFLMISRHLHLSARNETLLACQRSSIMRLSAAPAGTSPNYLSPHQIPSKKMKGRSKIGEEIFTREYLPNDFPAFSKAF